LSLKQKGVRVSLEFLAVTLEEQDVHLQIVAFRVFDAGSFEINWFAVNTEVRWLVVINIILEEGFPQTLLRLNNLFQRLGCRRRACQIVRNLGRISFTVKWYKC